MRHFILVVVLFFAQAQVCWAQRWWKICGSCNCDYINTSFNDVSPEQIPWVKERRRTIVFHYLICEEGQNAHEIPSNTPRNIEAVKFVGTHPVLRNGLRRQLLERFTQIEFFNFRNVEVRTIDVDFLYPHRNTVKMFYFTYNPFTDIPVGIFQQSPSLEVVIFWNNQIKQILSGLCANMPRLKGADFHSNKINLIEVGAFHKSPILEWICIQHNMLTFLDGNIVSKKVYENPITRFHDNPWYCTDVLCPFMQHTTKRNLKCSEPRQLGGKAFSVAIQNLGIKVDQVRHSVDIDSPVQMRCSACGTTKLAWHKDEGDLPSSVAISQAAGTRTSTLSIAKVKVDHEGNYTCSNPECKEGHCPKPVVSLMVILPEPDWNFTGHESDIDHIVRYGNSGSHFGLIALGIFAILMAICLSGYWLYVEVKKRRQVQQPQEIELQPVAGPSS